MTPRERLIRVFKCLDVDRMPIRLWGVDPMFPVRDDWQPLIELTEKYQLEIIRTWSPSKEEVPESVCKQCDTERIIEERSIREITTTIETPAGLLTRIFHQPISGAPGYVRKHCVENIEDAKKWLSIPDDELPVVDSYFELEKKTGSRAMLMVGIDEAMYMVQRLMGSEVFGYWLYDERDLLREMIDRAYKKIERLVKHYLSKGLGDAYGWVGPELCIPPLASVKDFYEFVVEYDRKIIDLVHESGKLTWIHCHGDMKPVLEGFINMGLDCLNPIEPPPVGKITLAEAKKICKGRMCLEGGVEDGAFYTKTPQEIKEMTINTINQGKPDGGFILCPSSSPNTAAILPPYVIENYRIFVETAVRLRNY
ncbi:MAG TPA: uroporphyrinogen decarboxylase family protein [bacterium]|nr:uroporphyrinogen decarboxylase family protein [bacterium]HOL50178.1 uroporphyrinogen decarboxylase family protein [bacterium]HPP08101.1 uroporphyrinogen decarboxylase family protein [bacterium]